MVGSAEFNEHLKYPGYLVAIFIRDGDFGCEQIGARCAEYSRLYPFVRFVSISVQPGEKIQISGMCLTFVPTIAIYRAGRFRNVIAGTDYSAIEKCLAETRRDGNALVNVAQEAGGVYRANSKNCPVFPGRAQAVSVVQAAAAAATAAAVPKTRAPGVFIA